MPARKHVVAPDLLDKPTDDTPMTQAYAVKSSWLRDTAERVFFTFAQAFLGVFGATQIVDAGSGHLDVGLARMALSAGIAAVLALVKAGVAAKVAGTVSPASLAPTPAPEPIDGEAGTTTVGVVLFVVFVIAILFLGFGVDHLLLLLLILALALLLL